jgi:hypothetical protein
MIAQRLSIAHQAVEEVKDEYHSATEAIQRPS